MLRIMFLCSAGMSTSLLVQKVEMSAKQKGVECKVWASAEADAKNYYDEVDVILLGPQVRFLLNKVKGMVEDKNVKVDVIDTVHYGRLNGDAILEQALKL